MSAPSLDYLGIRGRFLALIGRAESLSASSPASEMLDAATEAETIRGDLAQYADESESLGYPAMAKRARRELSMADDLVAQLRRMHALKLGGRGP